MSRRGKIFLLGVGTLLLLLLVVWLWPNGAATPTTQTLGLFGTSAGQRSFGNSPTDTTGGSGQSAGKPTKGKQNIFKIADGPVTAATFIQTGNPTTTLVRFVVQENGHVYDLPIDVPGAILRPVSNTTIPGTQHTLWVESGNAAVLQYLDTSTVKTVYVTFPKSAAAAASVGRVQFLPDNIIDLGASPNGTQVVYLLKAANGGADGYISAADGAGAKKLFSIPLTQLLVSWPAPTTILLQTRSAAGTAGTLFLVGAKSGSILPLVYGSGVTAVANNDFSQLVYQTRMTPPAVSGSYVHLFKTGKDYSLPLDITPERCIWGTVATSTLFCALPYKEVASDYLDLWHQGSVAQSVDIFAIDTAHGSAEAVAAPGPDGGADTDIDQLAVSPDNRFLLYVTRGDRSLWGVRLTK